MTRKFPPIFMTLSVLTLLLCAGSLKTNAQVITGSTSVYGGSTYVYELSPHVSSSVYVAWCLSWHSGPDGQIISAPVNSCLEGYGINTCYVTWATNVDRASLQVDFPRGGASVSSYTLYVTRQPGFNGADSLVVTNPAGGEVPVTIRKQPAFNYLSFRQAE